MKKAMHAFVIANVREVIFATGLVLVTIGLAMIYAPLALIGPGLLLIWLATPPSKG